VGEATPGLVEKPVEGVEVRDAEGGSRFDVEAITETILERLERPIVGGKCQCVQHGKLRVAAPRKALRVSRTQQTGAWMRDDSHAPVDVDIERHRRSAS
jgi:uncharacterized protein (UPF0261 family)